jgi:hypothetical protein
MTVRTIRYEIYADEAWTHSSLPLLRYHCFFGGIFGSQSLLGRLETDLIEIKKVKMLATTEIKWSSLKPAKLETYKQLVDCFFDHLDKKELTYRQMFRDRSFVFCNETGNTTSEKTELDVQFMLFYQFIKHAFGLEFLPVQHDVIHEILVRLDGHSSQRHKDQLESYINQLNRLGGRNDIIVKASFIDSKSSNVLQLCDVIMGAAGSYGNKQHKLRSHGQRGMTKAQKPRFDLSKYIYNKIKELDAKHRGSRAFNWFESTGMQGQPEFKLHHKLRIWKYIPKNYLLNKGWHNDHLNKYGCFVADEINTLTIHHFE